MSKINLEFDTETKDLELKIDGVAVPNVTCVEIYPASMDGYDIDEYRCCITTQMMDEDKDINTMTRMVASNTKEGKLIKTPHPLYKGFAFVVKPTIKKLQKQIMKYFGVK